MPQPQPKITLDEALQALIHHVRFTAMANEATFKVKEPDGVYVGEPVKITVTLPWSPQQ